jgi:hypothetical protein
MNSLIHLIMTEVQSAPHFTDEKTEAVAEVQQLGQPCRQNKTRKQTEVV